VIVVWLIFKETVSIFKNSSPKPTIMKSLGLLLIIIGAVTIIYGFMDRVPRILEWIYRSGEGTAWAIKIGFVVVGLILFIIGSRRKPATSGDSTNP
jgi:hypothetical protein